MQIGGKIVLLKENYGRPAPGVAKSDGKGQDEGRLLFPDTKEPNFWDFAYFSSCLTMTFQTPDVNISCQTFRRIVIFHTLGAFVFNIGVIAFSINILGGS